MEHRLAPTRNAHPGTVGAALVRHLLPELHGEQISVALVIELPDLGIAVRVRAERAAEVAGIDHRDDDHERELLRPRPQAVSRALRARVGHVISLVVGAPSRPGPQRLITIARTPL